MELTRDVLEFVAASGCVTRNGCTGCMCVVWKDDDNECDSPESDQIAALALSLMDERDRLREALDLALDRCRCNGMGVVLTETELGETGEEPCPHCADIRKLTEG